MTESQLANLKKGNRFSKDNQPKNAGRKPSKLKGLIQQNDLAAEDIMIMLSNLVDKSILELNEIANDKSKPIILTTFAEAMLKDKKNGNSGTIESMLDRWIGKATQKVEQTGDMKNSITVEIINPPQE